MRLNTRNSTFSAQLAAIETRLDAIIISLKDVVEAIKNSKILPISPETCSGSNPNMDEYGGSLNGDAVIEGGGNCEKIGKDLKIMVAGSNLVAAKKAESVNPGNQKAFHLEFETKSNRSLDALNTLNSGKSIMFEEIIKETNGRMDDKEESRSRETRNFKLIDANVESVEHDQQETLEPVTNRKQMKEISLHANLDETEVQTHPEDEHEKKKDELAAISLPAIENDLQSLHARSSGPVARPSSKGFGFICFSTKDAAHKAIELIESMLEGKKVFKRWGINLQRHSVSTHQWVYEAGQPTIEWLIAWHDNIQLSDYQLEDKSIIGAGCIDRNPDPLGWLINWDHKE